jgi:hypothetical protein
MVRYYAELSPGNLLQVNRTVYDLLLKKGWLQKFHDETLAVTFRRPKWNSQKKS